MFVNVFKDPEYAIADWMCASLVHFHSSSRGGENIVLQPLGRITLWLNVVSFDVSLLSKHLKVDGPAWDQG